MARDLLAIILVVVVLGLVAGAFGLGAQVQEMSAWSPRDYVAPPGSCIVPAQGDPIYDEWYAKNVNNPNCDAFIKQEQAKNLEAQTEKTKVETRQNLFAVYGIFVLVASGVVLIVVKIITG